MWAGYAFAIDFREERGHAYMLEDQTFTERQRVAKQPGTCLHCHASVYTAYKKLGQGDLVKGFEALNRLPYVEAREYVQFPVACIDCHDPETMQLRVTRPALITGLRELKKSEGVEDYDVNTMATRQEMRTYVCAQCHVEYYFQGDEKRLVLPWSRGIRADEILSYYEEPPFKDWTHAETEAPALKVQHPEFELWRYGIHSRSGVACADCHMPYMRVGALKISDHHVRSPVLNINHACQTCHHFAEEELRQRVESIQETTCELRDLALDGLMDLIQDIREARAEAAADEAINTAREYQREAQFFIDFVEVENSMGFHAPQEAARILARAIDCVRKGQTALREDYEHREEDSR
jgi:nitrite reductase (cytochrome c-552)